MFYVEDKMYEYPSCPIIVDVLTRFGTDGSTGTTGKIGCREMLEVQLGHFKDMYSVEQIVSGYADYSAEKGHPDDEGIMSEVSASERKQYFTRLEDIEDDVIHEYARNVIIGFKKNKGGRRAIDRDNEVSRYGFEDEEDGGIIELADLEIAPTHFTVDEVCEARVKLPYLLKMLQKGSELIGAHLLSFIIRKVQVSGKQEDVGYIQPRYFFGLHKLSSDGEISPGVYENQDNTRMDTTRGFRAAVHWINSVFDGIEYMIPYYDMFKELQRVCDILQLDLASENPLNYGKDVVDKATCLYLASNEEYIDCYGFVDKKICKLLEEENLFKKGSASALNLLKQSISEKQGEYEENSQTDSLSEVSGLIEEFIELGRMPVRLALVKRFLVECLHYTEQGIAAMTINKGLVYGKGGRLITVRDKFFVQGGEGRCVLTIAGYLVLLRSISEDPTLYILDLEDAISSYSKSGGTGYYDCFKL